MRSERLKHATKSIALQLTAVSIPWAARLLGQEPTTVLVLGGATVLVAYLALAAIEAYQSPLVITPLSFYFLWYASSLGLSPIYMAGRIEAREDIAFSTVFIPPDYLVSGYLIFLLGSAALHIGIQVLRPTPAPSAALVVDNRQSTLVLTAMWLLSVIVRLDFGFLSFIGSFRGLFIHGSLAVVCIHALRGRDPGFRNVRYYLLLVLGVLAELVMNIRSGSKAFIMYSFIPLAWPVVTIPRLRLLLLPLGATLVPFYLYVVAPVVTTARAQRMDESQGMFLHVAGVYQRGEYVSDDTNQFGRYLERQFEPVPIGFIRADVERFGYRYGETLDYLGYAFIPRAIWPEKPYVSRGAWFTMYLGAASSEETATSSTGITAAGEMYWNFGYPGVLLGLFVIGLFVGWQWRLAGPQPEANPIRFLLYVALMLEMPSMAEAGTTIIAAVYRLLALSVLLTLLTALTRMEAGRGRRVFA